MKRCKLLRVFAEGGMRDALSIIDQAISYSDEIVTTEDVLAVTGSVSQQYLGNLVECIRDNDVSRALRIIDDMMSKGKRSCSFYGRLYLLLSGYALISNFTTIRTYARTGHCRRSVSYVK